MKKAVFVIFLSYMTFFCHASPAYDAYLQVYQKKGLDNLRLAASPTKDYIALIKTMYNPKFLSRFLLRNLG